MDKDLKKSSMVGDFNQMIKGWDSLLLVCTRAYLKNAYLNTCKPIKYFHQGGNDW